VAAAFIRIWACLHTARLLGTFHYPGGNSACAFPYPRPGFRSIEAFPGGRPAAGCAGRFLACQVPSWPGPLNMQSPEPTHALVSIALPRLPRRRTGRCGIISMGWLGVRSDDTERLRYRALLVDTACQVQDTPWPPMERGSQHIGGGEPGHGSAPRIRIAPVWPLIRRLVRENSQLPRDGRIAHSQAGWRWSSGFGHQRSRSAAGLPTRTCA